MPQVMDATIGALPIFDEAGQSHALHSCWAHGTAVIGFLRHFG